MVFHQGLLACMSVAFSVTIIFTTPTVGPITIGVTDKISIMVMISCVVIVVIVVAVAGVTERLGFSAFGFRLDGCLPFHIGRFLRLSLVCSESSLLCSLACDCSMCST